MFATLRLKEKILIGIILIFIPMYASYTQFIAPRFGEAKLKNLERQIQNAQKKLDEDSGRQTNISNEMESIKQKIRINDEQIVKMRAQADEFKKYILSDKYEVDLYQYLFGRDARYTVLDLGNTPKRLPKGNYTEIIYNYEARGFFPDILKLVKKIETTSRSLSISNLKLEKPRLNIKEGEKDDGTILASLQIHVILSALDSALSYEEFKKSSPDLEIKKIDGNPWDSNFGAAQENIEGPVAPIKKLYLQSVIYVFEPNARAARFEGRDDWIKEGQEFEIEPGKSYTTCRLIAIGGRYVVVKHLNKNSTYKIILNIRESGDEKDEARNSKILIADESGVK